jgi:hypothetical protein
MAYERRRKGNAEKGGHVSSPRPLLAQITTSASDLKPAFTCSDAQKHDVSINRCFGEISYRCDRARGRRAAPYMPRGALGEGMQVRETASCCCCLSYNSVPEFATWSWRLDKTSSGEGKHICAGSKEMKQTDNKVEMHSQILYYHARSYSTDSSAIFAAKTGTSGTLSSFSTDPSLFLICTVPS